MKAPLMVVLAAAVCVVLAGATAWGQATSAVVYSNDGAMQSPSGGWDLPWDECSEDTLLTTYTRPECRQIIFSPQGTCSVTTATTCTKTSDCPGGETCEWVGNCSVTTATSCSSDLDCPTGNCDITTATSCHFDSDCPGGETCVAPELCTNFTVVPAYDGEVTCEGAGKDWASSRLCTDGSSRYADDCAHYGGTWLGVGCRALFDWDPSYGFPTSSSDPNYRDNCTRCHNAGHYPPGYHGEERGNGETVVMTGHKNMGRPVKTSVGYPYYTATYGWAGSDGSLYATDSSGNTINWSTGEITVSTIPLDLLWIYNGWIGSAPRAVHEDTGSYGCGRCHMTGWISAKDTSKEPYVTFGDPVGNGVSVTGSWDQWGIQCSRCHGSQNWDNDMCDDNVTPCTTDLDCGGGTCNLTDLRHHPNIAGKEATGSSSTGATRTALCMDCHRQETGDSPYDGGLTPTVLKVGDAHGHLGFLSHWHGNLYLNSPHARFGGIFDDINDNTLYDSHFMAEGESYPFANEQGGCSQCHNPHKSTVPDANPAGGAIHEDCTDCHSKNLSTLVHPAGPGTPLEDLSDPAAPCVTCHMPDNLHLFRINADVAYSTFPVDTVANIPDNQIDCEADGGIWTGSACIYNANTQDHEGYADAVWVDVDHACGQCHGGGTNEVDNPTSNGAGYMTKVELAGFAAGIHNDAAYATFGYQIGAHPNTRTITVSAMGTYCYGPCNVYSWDWGDATPAGSGLTTSHTYASGGTYTITLTAYKYGAQPGTASKFVTVYDPDLGPTSAGMNCGTVLDADTWTASFTDASTDDNGVAVVTVNWGDGSLKESGAQGTAFSHTYSGAGPRVITHVAYDGLGQEDTTACTVNPAYFTIAGTVYESDAATAVPSARVTVKNGGLVVRTVYTALNGSYSAGSLRPGAYTLTVTKAGYTFADPAAGPITVGPSDLAADINATTP